MGIMRMGAIETAQHIDASGPESLSSNAIQSCVHNTVLRPAELNAQEETMLRLRFALIILVTWPHCLQAQQPVVDGNFDEWQCENVVATDLIGDGQASFDVSCVSAYSVGTVVYLHFDIGQTINLQNGLPQDGTLKLILESNGKQMTIDFRARTASDGSAEHIGWDRIGFQCLPTYASDKYEMRIDLGVLGVKTCDRVSIQFAGSDSLDQPATIVLQQRWCNLPCTQVWTKPERALRIINQNTLNNGLSDSNRGPAFKRIFAAVNADVWCFQEEWEEDLFRKGMANTLGSMTVHWNRACAIASRHKLEKLPMATDWGAAGLITTGDGRKVVVISVHFKCCGFAGSNEDELRIEHAHKLVEEIKRLREGAFGEAAKTAPVMLIGDYNLVGSRDPLDIINAAGLKDVVCTAGDGTAHTWRGLTTSESFWPGRLDLVATTGFHSVNGRLFDTGRLSESELEQLGVAKQDSLASDHVMLVVDCELR